MQSPLAIRVICSVELSLGHQVQKLRYRHMYKPLLGGYWWLGVGQVKQMGRGLPVFPGSKLDHRQLQMTRIVFKVCRQTSVSLYWGWAFLCVPSTLSPRGIAAMSVLLTTPVVFWVLWTQASLVFKLGGDLFRSWVGVLNGGVLNVGSKSFVPQGELGLASSLPILWLSAKSGI